MLYNKLTNRAKLGIIILLVLLLCGGLLWLSYRSRRQVPARIEKVRQIDEAPQPPPPRREETQMGRVQVELERVIDSWCDAEAGSYEPQSSLQGLWRRKYPTTPPYNPRGITKLIAKIGDNQFFKDCNAANNIGPGYFLPSGGIQTVGDLHEFLTPCEENI